MADQKAELAVAFVFDALAPTNFLPANPAAVKRAFETGGASLLAGARNFAMWRIRSRSQLRPESFTRAL